MYGIKLYIYNNVANNKLPVRYNVDTSVIYISNGNSSEVLVTKARK